MTHPRFPGVKRLYFDRLFQRSYWTWRRHPLIIVPSMLTTAVNVIEQSAITLAVIIFATSLVSRGLLPSFLNALAGSGGILTTLQDSRFSFALFTLIGTCALAFLLIAIFAGGFVISSEFGTYLQAWREDTVSFGSLLENGSRRWRSMAWTYFLSNLITWGPAIIAYAILFLSILVGTGSPSGGAGILITSQFAEIGIGASLVLSIFTVYAYPAVIADTASGLGAVRHSFRVASHNLGITVTYGLVRGVFQLIITLVVLTAGTVSLPLASFSAAILSLLLTPILHSTKMMIYAYARPEEPEMPFEVAGPIWNDIAERLPRAAWHKIRTGLSEIRHFLLSPGNIPFHIASTMAFIIGILWGVYLSNNGIADFLRNQGYVPGRGNPVLNHVLQRPVLGLDIFLNNWLVSIATGLSGIGFGVPSFQTILFNGLIVGILIPLTPLTMFLAAILPHGIIEIPSFILSGSVGLKLGYAAWKAMLQHGEESRAYLSLTLKQTVYIVIGLAPLFFIAGLIEGTVTPWIMQLAGWKF